MDELTYQKDGLDIKTSRFLKNRGSCCKTSCLHCPYGFTIKKEGLQFEELDSNNFAEAKEIDKRQSPEENDVAATLLASVFGNTKPRQPLTEKNQKDYMLVKLKGENCALIKKNNLQAKEIYLQKYFENQDITLEIVNSYLSEN